MVDGILKDLPESVTTMMNDIMLTKLYNAATGASITHRDIQEWGFLERETILASIELM